LIRLAGDISGMLKMLVHEPSLGSCVHRQRDGVLETYNLISKTEEGLEKVINERSHPAHENASRRIELKIMEMKFSICTTSSSLSTPLLQPWHYVSWPAHANGDGGYLNRIAMRSREFL